MNRSKWGGGGAHALLQSLFYIFKNIFSVFDGSASPPENNPVSALMTSAGPGLFSGGGALSTEVNAKY